jgi:transposase
MKGDLLSGDIFIFINRRRNQCKLLRFCGDGFELYHKKLIKGTFQIPEGGEIEAYQLQLLLEGIIIGKVLKKARFSLNKIT